MAQFDAERSVQQTLFTNDSWITRRKWLRRSMLWEAGTATAIIVYAARTNSENAILQLALPVLLTAFTTQLGLYVFGANQDDIDKRKYVPSPNKEQAAATSSEEFHEAALKSTPPPGFGNEEEN